MLAMQVNSARICMQEELDAYRSAHQQDLNEAVSAMDTYSQQADMQQGRICGTEQELRRTALVLQDVVSVCTQHQEDLAQAVAAKEELEQQVVRQDKNLQEALSLLRDLLPEAHQRSNDGTIEAAKRHQVRFL
jgi:phage-related tail protein